MGDNIQIPKQLTVEVPRELIEEIIHLMGEECRYDHHGYCQEHNLQDKEDCWVYKLKKLLVETN